MTKKELRRAMRRLNLALSPSERAAASAGIFARVERLEAFAAARTVALYCSLPDEPDTAEALRRWSAAKRLVVPRVEGEAMHFYDYDPQALARGAFGIAEPAAAARRCEPSGIDLVIVPGVAFTAGGGRCGRGRGYYDRYLAQADVRAVKAGVCFAHQVVGSLPAEPHDVPMDVVLCDG